MWSEEIGLELLSLRQWFQIVVKPNLFDYKQEVHLLAMIEGILSKFITIFVPYLYHLPHWKPANESRLKANLSRLISHALYDASQPI